MKIELSDGSKIDVVVSRKAMKNIRLRVGRDGTVGVSAPQNVSDSRIQEFVNAKRGWIESHIRNFEKADDDGDTILFLGIKYTIEVVKDRRTGVALNDNNMNIFCSNPDEYEVVLQKWWIQQAATFLNEAVNKWFPIIDKNSEKSGGEKPAIKIRKMKTLWGSCTSAERAIRFNYYLMCSSPECVEYVVLHELTHLLYPNHGMEFKTFLTKYMPDWKERKKRLESECATVRMF
ncbi:MAG: SprT family zinc-dependent metalloprotease [Christensenella sp.]